MADVGISGIIGGATRLSPAQRRVGQPTGEIQSPSNPGQARGDTTRNARPPGQVVNLDGRSFDRQAPRGTYINIVA
jgi:hypothetical protein